jgi:ABC-2 type transport system ATP-binding protein
MHRQLVSDSGRPLITASGLSKSYGRRRAVDDLSMAVRSGEVCALLGPNGAGKTSTMRMLAGLSRPDEGRVHLLGEPASLGARVLRHAGVLIDGPAFVPHLTGLRNLRLFWSAGGRDWPPPALDDALELAGLGPSVDQKVKGYSMGMKQRLMLAQAIMRAPSVLILDEPANGLDPAEVRALRQRLRALAENGAAVLISSHQLAEVQQLATHAVIMNHGTLVAEGALATLLSDNGTTSLEEAFLAMTEGGDDRAPR